MPFKSQVYSKYGSLTFFFFGSWSLVEYLIVSVKAKFFLITLTLQTYLTFNVSMKMINELYVFLTGFILCLQQRSCYSTMLY